MDKLQSLFKLQTTLIEHYMKVYGLPPIPLVIDNAEHQDVVRHLVSSTIEELSESFTVFKHIYDLYTKEPDLTTVPEAFKELNHELSDTLHFFIELLLYCNVTPESIEGYTESFAAENNLTEAILPLGVLERLFFIVREIRAADGIKDNIINMVFKNIPEIYSGGKNINMKSIVEIPLLMWNITHNLHLAQNELKNKAWKQTKVPTDVLQFQKNILVSFMAFINLLSTLSHTAVSIHLLYKEKNDINLKRIESKY